MNFKIKKIRKNLKVYQQRQKKEQIDKDTSTLYTSKPDSLHKKQKLIQTSVLGIAVLCIFILGFLTIQLVKSIDFGSIIFSFGQTLKTDQNDQTNFLLVGIGGANHDGGNLTDTLIIANLNSKTDHVKLISIPRDLYISDKDVGNGKINRVYDSYLIQNNHNKKIAIEKFKQKISNITGVNIQYVIIVDFNGFVKIVNSLGGINVDVKKALYDPYYPLGETTKYTTVQISAGPHHFDGATALKFARSRETTSDFDRSKRQQQIMVAIRTKALNLNILTNPGRLQSLYNSVASSIYTDLNVAEILEAAKIAKNINKNQIENRVITDDFTSCGGILYTPPRDLYGGASVLIPIGHGYNELQKFIFNYFHTPAAATQDEIQILNGTRINGLADKYLNMLSRACLNTVYYGNATERNLKKSVIYYKAGLKGKEPAALPIIQQIINAPAQANIPPEYLDTKKRQNSTIVVDLGKDYSSIAKKDLFDSLPVYTPKPTIPKHPEQPLNSGNSSALNTSTTSSTSTSNSKPTTTHAPISNNPNPTSSGVSK